MSDDEKRPAVAIVGSGIAGLSCAYLLSHAGDYDVYLFESESQLGMDAHSVDIPLDDENVNQKRVDAPPRAFSKEFYPNLWNLYEHSGVPTEKFDWTFTCSVQDSPSAYFNSGDPSPIFSKLWHFISFDNLRCLYDALKFYAQIMYYSYYKSALSKITCSKFLESYSEDFKKNLFLPIMSMICTCSYEAVMEYPMDIVLDYFMKNGTYNQYRSKHGSCEVVKTLSQFAKEIHLNSPVTEIWHASEGQKPKLKVLLNREHEREFSFDQIIVASQAVTAVKLIKSLHLAEEEALNAIHYEYSDVVVHQDANLMPLDPAAWAPMNFILSKDRSQVMFTLLMNIEGREEPVYQTWNPVVDPAPELVYKRTTMLRPTVTLQSVEAIQKLNSLQGRDGIWFCGAYAEHAIPLQENGVRSAVRVASALGVEALWW